MKRIITVIAAILMFASIQATAQKDAQKNAQKGWYFGLAGSAQSTWITNQNNYGLPEMDYDKVFHGAGNLNVGYEFTNHLGAKMEIGYGTYGQKYKDTWGVNKDSIIGRDIKMNYLMIPLMFKYRIGGEVAKFYVAIGPQFDFLMSATQVYTMNGNPYVDTLATVSGQPFAVGQEDIKERYNSMDIKVRMDLGLDLTVAKHLLIEFGLKLGYGLIDINASDYHLKDHSDNNTGAYHPSHSIFGGLMLGLNYKL
ncbi:MAG: outer membrane beta-barrel protein [Bacteroidetes bacterium]|nr:outer membrane beta-barrel protein [Bacteroidota bacterium]